MTRRLAGPFALALLLVACDGGGTDDAGPPDAPRPAIVFTVDSIELSPTVTSRAGGAIAPTFGEQFYVARVTLEAVEADGLPVAPNAFILTLADDTDVNADTDGTNGAMDGCDSRSVDMGTSTTCVVAFEVDAAPAAARSVTWTNGGSLRETARVPAG